MSHDAAAVSLHGDACVYVFGTVYPEPIPAPDEVAPAWNHCRIPGCTHSPPCPAKLRAWGSYGNRYICQTVDCDHDDCPPRRRADEDRQPFGVRYRGPALPQHTRTRGDEPVGPRMQAIQDAAGDWHLIPMSDAR